MNRSRFTALAAAAALSLSAFASCGRPSAPRVEPANMAFYSSQGPLTLVDIRGREAYDLGHLPSASLMEYGVIMPDALDAAPKEQPLVVYGEAEDGKDEERAAATLAAAGFKKVAVLKGGMAAYAALKLPTHSTEDDKRAQEMMEEFRKQPPHESVGDAIRREKKMSEKFAEEFRARKSGN